MKPATEVTVGRIAGAFGIHGELKCDPTGAGRIVFSPGTELRCARADDVSTVRITGARTHKGRLLIRIEGVEDADAAAAYAGALLSTPRERIALAPGEYLDDDLIGCEVQGKDGTPYGAVERVEHYPSSDMLVVDGAMIPMVQAIVMEISLDHRRIIIDPPEGLFE
ncbi:MAG TPA: ribosome maturation factor RimM [Candidatus Cybelea sp.]|jgi:16S rRNA processing protein RimM|nr:ribosome maturation factor RimM [Candidatus Cybelea sp.]